jgi:hypothetical protein
MGDRGEKTATEIISRLAMLVVAAGLILGGMKCLHMASLTAAEYYKDNPHPLNRYHDPAYSLSGTPMLLKIGWAMISAGALFLIGSIFPVSVVDQFMNPPDE